MNAPTGNLNWEDERKPLFAARLIEESLRLVKDGDPDRQMWNAKSLSLIQAVLPLVSAYEARGAFDIEMLSLESLDAFASSDVDSSLITPLREFLLALPQYRLAKDRAGAAISDYTADQFRYHTMSVRCLSPDVAEVAPSTGGVTWEDETPKLWTAALIEESLRLQCENWCGWGIAFIHAVLPMVAVNEARGVFDIEMLQLASLDQFASSDVDSPLIDPIREFLVKVPGYRLASDRNGAPLLDVTIDQFDQQIARVQCLKAITAEEAHA